MSYDAAVIQSSAPARPSRRTLIAGAVWAAPVVLGLASSPAVAASDGDTPQQQLAASVPVEELVVDAYSLSNLNEGGKGGPLGWAGGHIGWWNSPSNLTAGLISYVVILTTPGPESITLYSGTATITLGQSITLARRGWGDAPLPKGTYTVSITVTAKGGDILTDSSSVDI